MKMNSINMIGKKQKTESKRQIRNLDLHLAILFLLMAIFLFLSNFIHAQNKPVSLVQVLDWAKNSPDAAIAKHEFLSSYWDYESVKASVYPELSLNGTLPNFNRSISKVTQPDGTDQFLSQFYSDYSAGLQISQNIPFTGGQISLKSGLERMDMFGDNGYTSFLSTPIQLGFTQPLFTYNSLKWTLKINPVKYNLAKQKYLEAVEKASVQAVQLYFDLLLVQNRLQNAEQNKNYADTLKFNAQQKYQSGKIIEAEYLQIELNALQSALQVETFKNEQRNALSKLKQFLQLKNEENWELTTPINIFSNEISVNTAQSLALENPLYQDFKVRELQSESNLMQAKAGNRINANLYAAFGLTQNANKFNEVYQNPMDQEIVSLGLQVPIWDWGKAKRKVKIAESQQEITRIQISQEQQDFEQALTLKVLQFNTQKTQVDISQKALDIALKRLQAQKDGYAFGKSSFTDLTNATTDKDNAVLTYLESLKSYWLMLYEIRQITLYDFEKGNKIQVDFEKITKGQ